MRRHLLAVPALLLLPALAACSASDEESPDNVAPEASSSVGTGMTESGSPSASSTSSGSADSGASSDASGAPADAPACTEVWVAGGSIPADYAGCLAEDGSLEVAETTECADGRQLLTGPSGFGFAGETATPTPAGLDEPDPASPEYAAALADCTG
ncbi:hypothetical protein INN71_07580 [Nocardioides sp. ChNu-153]|uniref:hypothetical protein n=1 Tax=unclassified Nocardioides TaxID=2615069 RepID=UPI002405D3D1|nr:MULTISPECIES: hypothetical protein [unclassified Nocardioides]MDF9715579.1 hypothetical protein [Nocardioides sp. ChNu-99]MDN7121251.1 hypothetical protein [Nocardioides sp. ChNu-153]